MKRSTSVTVAAALLMGGGVFVALLAALGVLGQMLIRRMAIQFPETPGGPGVRGAMIMVAGIEGLLAVWAIVTAIGIFRLRNWARISILVLSGFKALTAGIALVLMIAVFAMLKSGTVSDEPPGTATFVGILAIPMYAIPVGCAIWWLVLFLRKNVRAQFQASATGAEMGAQSSVLNPPTAHPAFPGRIADSRKIPTSIFVIEVYLLATAPLGLLGLPFVARQGMPTIFLGFLITGWRVWASVAIMMICAGVLGFGFLRRKTWAIDGTIAYAVFTLLNTLLCAFSSAYGKVVEAIFRNVSFPFQFPVESYHQLMGRVMTFSLIFSILVTAFGLYLLVTRRRAYLAACSSRTA